MGQHGITSYAELPQRSTQDIAWFTEAVLQYLDIRFQVPYTRIVDVSMGIRERLVFLKSEAIVPARATVKGLRR